VSETEKIFQDAPTPKQIAELMVSVRDNLDKLIGDGHSLYKPSKYSWLPKWIVVECTHTYFSNYSDFKETIYDPKTGKAIDKVEGVYNLTMLYTIAGYLNVSYKSMMGRGFQARAIVEDIKKLFKDEEAEDKRT